MFQTVWPIIPCHRLTDRVCKKFFFSFFHFVKKTVKIKLGPASTYCNNQNRRICPTVVLHAPSCSLLNSNHFPKQRPKLGVGRQQAAQPLSLTLIRRTTPSSFITPELISSMKRHQRKNSSLEVNEPISLPPVGSLQQPRTGEVVSDWLPMTSCPSAMCGRRVR